MAQRTGTVKWFDEGKGYGFISPDDGDEDLFVHHTGIAGSGGYKTSEAEAEVRRVSGVRNLTSWWPRRGVTKGEEANGRRQW